MKECKCRNQIVPGRYCPVHGVKKGTRTTPKRRVVSRSITMPARPSYAEEFQRLHPGSQVTWTGQDGIIYKGVVREDVTHVYVDGWEDEIKVRVRTFTSDGLSFVEVPTRKVLVLFQNEPLEASA